MIVDFDTPIVIVGYRNASDVSGCLKALKCALPTPSFEVFVAENGGPAAYEALIGLVTAPGGPCCFESDETAVPPDRALRRVRLRMNGAAGAPARRVNIAEMSDNLGYAGGINAWLLPLMAAPRWRAAWVLNPDTEPTPNALAELAAYAEASGKGLIGCRLVLTERRDLVQTRGLAWNKLRATVEAVDRAAPAAEAPDPQAVERRLDAPSGASTYATRELIEQIGVMSEHYFLYFEDLDWGIRAKKLSAVGYTNDSIVYHRGGSTIGSAWRRREKSRLSVYLNARNQVIFVKEHYPIWLVWTVIVSLAHAASFVAAGALSNASASLHGLRAGLAGEIGRPAM